MLFSALGRHGRCRRKARWAAQWVAQWANARVRGGVRERQGTARDGAGACKNASRALPGSAAVAAASSPNPAASRWTGRWAPASSCALVSVWDSVKITWTPRGGSCCVFFASAHSTNKKYLDSERFLQCDGHKVGQLVCEEQKMAGTLVSPLSGGGRGGHTFALMYTCIPVLTRFRWCGRPHPVIPTSRFPTEKVGSGGCHGISQNSHHAFSESSGNWCVKRSICQALWPDCNHEVRNPGSSPRISKTCLEFQAALPHGYKTNLFLTEIFDMCVYLCRHTFSCLSHFQHYRSYFKV